MKISHLAKSNLYTEGQYDKWQEKLYAYKLYADKHQLL